MIYSEQDISIEDYHLHPAVSNTKLADLRLRGPLFYWMKYIQRVLESESTEAMALGNALELFFFDQPAFERRYAIKPAGMTFASNAGKAWRAAAEARKQSIIKAEDLEDVGRMAGALRGNPLVMELIQKGRAQLTARYKGAKQGEPDFGLDVQSRPDWFNPDGCRWSEGRPYFVDLKKTRDFGEWYDPRDPSSPRAGMPIWKYGYHRQAGIVERAFAQEGYRDTDHFLAVVEEIPPYRCHAFRMGEAYREIGWRAAARDMVQLRQCLETNQWPALPGIGSAPIQLEPPTWLEEREAREYDAAGENGRGAAVAS